MSQSSASGRPTRIFIVDDHALVRHGLRELIAHESDLEVCGDAEGADTALQQIAATMPDLLIVDISLKSGSGLELIKRVKSHHPDIKVLVSTMHDESLFAERALHAGASGYVNKHESTDKVIEAIRRVLAGHVYLSSTMTDELLQRVAGVPAASSSSSIDTLSDRELEVFALIGKGLGTRTIAERLHLSVKTIETYREHIKQKLSLKTSAELARRAAYWDLQDR
jgi:DNA-binding NarL/FixJ family response regulator